MIFREYIMVGKLFEGSIVLKYHLNGIFYSIKIEAELSIEQYRALRLDVLKTEESFLKTFGGVKGLSIKEVPPNLSFESFWEVYDYKVGKKVQTQNFWDKMPEGDKIKALLYIPKLKTTKKMEGTQMPYPSTYLSQRYFDV
ncbi:MAG: hypothetical protein C4K58_06840 [Flavobacteriaceae bacterium]|nr:MAG: hypothetical protein C4K58_06840 [Flavobacteriaceae bacterium]